jgi:hypothetical protein
MILNPDDDALDDSLGNFSGRLSDAEGQTPRVSSGIGRPEFKIGTGRPVKF